MLVEGSDSVATGSVLKLKGFSSARTSCKVDTDECNVIGMICWGYSWMSGRDPIRGDCEDNDDEDGDRELIVGEWVVDRL